MTDNDWTLEDARNRTKESHHLITRAIAVLEMEKPRDTETLDLLDKARGCAWGAFSVSAHALRREREILRDGRTTTAKANLNTAEDSAAIAFDYMIQAWYRRTLPLDLSTIEFAVVLEAYGMSGNAFHTIQEMLGHDEDA